MRDNKRTHNTRLAELQALELKAKQAHREADLAAGAANREAEAAEEAVVTAHADGTDLKVAEKQLEAAEHTARHADLAARGAAKRLEQAQADVRHYRAEHHRELIEEDASTATAPAEKFERGKALILEADAEWRHQAQVVADHLLAAGIRPADEVPAHSGIEELARALARHDKPIPPAAPHWQGRKLREEQDATAREVRAERKQRDGLAV